MLIDTHAHLYLKEFEADIDDIISRAIQNGITRFYLPAIDSETTASMLELEKKFPENCIAMIGLHPCSVKENYKGELAEVERQLSNRTFAGIGEAGLDFYWDKTFIKEQYLALECQIELALQYQLPVILHTRTATQETIDVIKKYASAGLTGIFHCFGGSIDEAKQIIDCGFYLGIGGVVTYKNSGLDVVLKDIDLQHIVLETDAPYLSPVPFRGKRNESAYLLKVAEKVAQIKNCSLAEVALATTTNANNIFRSE